MKKLPNLAVIRQLYEDGLTSTEIGKRYGVTNFAVIVALRKGGVQMKPRGNTTIVLTPDQRELMMALYVQRKSHVVIGEALRLSTVTVSRLLRKEGIFTKQNCRERHGWWKGGRIRTADGYIRVLVDSTDPYESMRGTTGYVLEHRLVLARELGRPLSRHETVHHINGDASDNRLENLQLRNGQHGKGSKMICLACGSHNVSSVHL